MDKALAAWKLVEGLNDIKSGESVQTQLLALGEDAVHALAYFILRSPGNLRPRSLAADPLLQALEEQHLVAAGESLAELKEKQAPPYLVELLEDSFKRKRASKAILKFGTDALEELFKTVKTKRTIENDEILPSIERRAEAAKLLGLIGDERAISWLINLLHDE